tara:strand:- start:68 stop:1129 length:1062 start_codon:yes stop_codon:yes gene_type:complete
LTKKPKVLFLYTEIAEYFVAACMTLAEKAEVFIIRWPVNSEAPFEFKVPEGVHIIDRNQYGTSALIKKVKELKPDVIFCSGWIDKGYLKVVKEFSGQIPTVLSMDNHWKGTPKQQIGSLVAQYTFLKDFDFAWVPGAKQVDYAKRLGFSEDKIYTGFYTANVERFNQVYDNSSNSKQTTYPKRFLYLGRYTEHKGIFDLWQGYKQYKKQGGTWELICAGTGDQWDSRVKSEGISHLGFKQPEEIPALIEQSGAYILPSHFEPWGVSVHEMAAAGLPLLLSEEVGSNDAFLTEGKNGFSFPQKSPDQIAEAMLRIEKMSDIELLKMGKVSHQKGNAINTQNWAETVFEILNFRT